MDTNENKILEYLDYIVRYERDKNKVITDNPAPMNMSRLIASVDEYEKDKLFSSQACTRKMIANKVLKNSILRRSFEIVVRECFDDIDFSALSRNAQYLKLKNNILSKYPELHGIDNKDFLRKIANSIAHGNYTELLKVENMEKRWKVGEEDVSLSELFKGDTKFSLCNLYRKDNIADYDTNSYNALKKMNLRSPMVEVTPLQMYMTLLEGNPYNNGETMGIRLDGISGHASCNIELSNGEIDEILFFLISNTKHKKQLTLEAKDETHINVSKGNTPLEDFNNCLDLNNIRVFDYADGTSSDIELDEYQMSYMKDEYLRGRDLFSTEYYEEMCGLKTLAEMLSINNHSELLSLSNMLTGTGLERLSYQNYLLTNNLRNYIAYACVTSMPTEMTTMQQLFAKEMRSSYALLQLYNTYAESLITETLLLLQIVEDRSLYTRLENNSKLLEIINSMEGHALTHFRTSTKYGNDEMSLLKHLRNSLTHMSYLINKDNNIFVYDRVSKRNRRLDYKFSLSLEQLTLIKDELFNVVAGHYPNINFGDEYILNNEESREIN